jgi:hypothetical protein
MMMDEFTTNRYIDFQLTNLKSEICPPQYFGGEIPSGARICESLRERLKDAV